MNHSHHALGVAIVCLVVASGCAKDRTEPVTQIIVTVHNQLEPRQALTRLELVVEAEDGTQTNVESFEIVTTDPDTQRGQLELPAAFTIVPPTRRAAAGFRLTVVGYGRDSASKELVLVRHTAMLTFSAGKTLQATFVLAGECAMLPCSGQTCSVQTATGARGGECGWVALAPVKEIDPPASDDPTALPRLLAAESSSSPPERPPDDGSAAENESTAQPQSGSQDGPCPNSPCEHGGKCVQDGTESICSCAGTGFEGPLCDQEIDECAGDHGCAPVAPCIDLRGARRCECPDTHWGDGEGAQGCETRVTQLAARASHTCALLVTGEVKCWGRNLRGQLGDGTFVDRSEPVLVQGLSDIIKIAVGDEHSCAITGDRAVHCWGANEVGQLGDGATTARHTPAPVQGGLLVEDIATGANHNCVRQGATEVWCWGWNFHGQLADTTRENHTVPSSIAYTSDGALWNAELLSAGETFSCVGHVQGVDCWGQYTSSDPDPKRPTRFVDVEVSSLAAGRSHACVATKSGQVQCWGDLTAPTAKVNGEGLASVDLGAGEAIGIAIGSLHACAVLSDGTVKCWEVYASGSFEPQQVQDLADVQQVVIGLDHGCALLRNGSVQCWELSTVAALNPDPPYPVRGF